MSTTSTRYSIYLESVINLAKTIVIKSTDVISAQNSYIKLMYGDSYVDETDPTTWKYYLNIAGKYHTTDTAMTVISLDTLKEISFDSTTLATHKATKKAYAYGTRQYMELVSRYPEQETLILGILYPVDIDTAVAADDGTILGYPDSYVETNEYSLINRLQDHVTGFLLRWNNRQYGTSDELFPTAILGLMYLSLVQAILNIRLAACGTNEAHSFHVREYLISHGLTDTQINYLTLKQSLWLYRNIAYIQRNVGKNATFAWLIENIMTARNLPLAGFSMIHDLVDLSTNLRPTPKFKRVALNDAYSADSKTVIEVTDLYDKEDELARNNATLRDDYEDAAVVKLKNSLSNVVKTKLVESKMVDETDSTPYTFESILLANWLWMAYQGTYSSYVSIINPRTNEKIPLSVKEAYLLMWYSYCAAGGVFLEKAPKLVAQHVPMVPAPTAAVLKTMADSSLVDSTLAQTLLDLMPTTDTIISTEVFYSFCQELYSTINIQRNYIALQQHKDARAYVEGMVSRIYTDMVLTIDDDLDYASWLSEKNVTLTGFTSDDYASLYKTIISEATGANLSTTYSVKNIQSAMVSIMRQLSSYSIQYHALINTSSIISGDWTATRVGDIDSSASTRIKVPNLGTYVQDEGSRGTNYAELSLDPDTEDLEADHTAKQYVDGIDEVNIYVSEIPYSFNFPVRNMKMSISVIGDEDFPGLTAFKAFTTSERWQLVDVYGNSPT